MLAAVLWGTSIFSMLVIAFTDPLVPIAFLALWVSIIKIGVWMTKERDEKQEKEGERRRRDSLY